MEEQVFFPGPYYPKPWLLVKPEELSDDNDDDDDEDEGPRKKPKRKPKKKDKSELEMDPAFHWCYGAPKDSRINCRQSSYYVYKSDQI